MRLSLLSEPAGAAGPHSSTEAWVAEGIEHSTQAQALIGPLPEGRRVGEDNKGSIDVRCAPPLRLSAPLLCCAASATNETPEGFATDDAKPA